MRWTGLHRPAHPQAPPPPATDSLCVLGGVTTISERGSCLSCAWYKGDTVTTRSES